MTEATSRRPPILLVVDDCPNTTDSLAQLARDWGYEVVVANDGPTALALAAHFQPEAAVVDIVMPGMDGYEVAHSLRQLPGLEGAFLIALTGHGGGRGAPVGDFDLYLRKPVDPDELERILSDHCQPSG